VTATERVLELDSLVARVRYIVTIWETLAFGTWDLHAACSLAETIGSLAHEARAYGFATLRSDLAHLTYILGRGTHVLGAPTNGDIAFVSQTLAAVYVGIGVVDELVVARTPAARGKQTVICTGCPLTAVCPRPPVPDAVW
jgi:hypothetical protein